MRKGFFDKSKKCGQDREQTSERTARAEGSRAPEPAVAQDSLGEEQSQHTVQSFTKYVADRISGMSVHDDDSSEDGDPQILPSGAIVCKQHKLDVCGACQVDYRDLNKERGTTAPPPQRPKVHKKDLKPATKIAQGQLDPAQLRPWAQDGGKLGKTFVNCFSMQEKIGSHTGARPVDDVNYDMRESMVVIAKMMDTTPCRHVTIQDDAQSTGLSIHILSALQWPRDDGSAVPILLCHYQTNSRSAPDCMQKMQHMVSAFQNPHGVKNIPTTRREVDGFSQLLRDNSKLLCASYVKEHAGEVPPTFELSFLSELKMRLPSSVSTCTCGREDATKRCSRCGCVAYCSKECQVADWKRHKKECRPPIDKSQLGEAVVVRMLDSMPDGNAFLSTVSLHQPLGQAARKIQNTSQPAAVRDGEVRIVKIQTPQARGEMMLVYDKTKDVQTTIHPGNTPAKGYNELFDLIERKGESGGRKGYFNAAVMGGGTELHVYAKEMLGLQPW